MGDGNQEDAVERGEESAVGLFVEVEWNEMELCDWLAWLLCEQMERTMRSLIIIGGR